MAYRTPTRCPTTTRTTPNHFQIAAYFDDYVDHFGLREQDHASAPRSSSVEPVDGRVGGDRRGRGRQARDASATAPCWSPTATTGTRAGPNRPSPAPRSSRASRSTSTTTASPTSCAASGCWCSGSATRRSTSRSSPRGSPTKTFLAMRRGAYVLPKYLERQADRRGPRPLVDPRCRSRCSASSSMRLLEHRGRRHDRLRPAQARPQAARGAPDRLLGAAAPARPRRHRGQAQHRPLRRRPHRPLRRRQRGGDRPRRLLHRLQDHLPVLRRRRSSRRRTTGCRSTGGSSRSSARASTSSASSSRSGRSCRWPRRSPNGSPTCSAAGRRYRRRRRCGGRSQREERKMRKRFVASKRHTIEVDFHPYLREIRRERKRAAQRA